jgi:hypothetical protein
VFRRLQRRTGWFFEALREYVGRYFIIRLREKFERQEEKALLHLC